MSKSSNISQGCKVSENAEHYDSVCVLDNFSKDIVSNVSIWMNERFVYIIHMIL